MNSKLFGIRKLAILSLFCLIFSPYSFGQNADKFFPAKELTTVGVYYYPEHWDSTQWERDFQNMAKMGFEFTHFAEFAWADRKSTRLNSSH